MKALIVERELGLAQKIASSLGTLGIETILHLDFKIALSEEFVEILIVNSDTPNIETILKNFKNSIKIVLFNSLDDDTEKIKKHCSDYLIRPFTVTELTKKIKQIITCRVFKFTAKSYEIFLQKHLDFPCGTIEAQDIKFPMILRISDKEYGHKLVFDLAWKLELGVKTVNINANGYDRNLRFCCSKTLYFVQNFDKVKRPYEKEHILRLVKDKKAIILTSDFETDYDIFDVKFALSGKNGESEIMSVDEYEKFIIAKYQYNFSDTKLAELLGISRKSLWEKRKKFDIVKEKKVK